MTGRSEEVEEEETTPEIETRGAITADLVPEAISHAKSEKNTLLTTEEEKTEEVNLLKRAPSFHDMMTVRTIISMMALGIKMRSLTRKVKKAKAPKSKNHLRRTVVAEEVQIRSRLFLFKT